jgi:hypothetical protein
MTLTLALRDGATVIVKESGTIEYRSETGRIYRRPGLGDYAASAAWVRGSAWGSDARHIVEQ